ncbi:hypothetical protein GGR03_000902 [Aurantimonas endophytica]|uniref:Uncharacterized protein n=1 Tax=Aurantimonas endophytica TaxID=1522175 RepID=A0A7W6HAX7_9HYPH|nr:hypothetical protein [Aurantimonas endophytica]
MLRVIPRLGSMSGLMFHFRNSSKKTPPLGCLAGAATSPVS